MTRVVVGVNRFEVEQGAAIPTFRLDPALERAQVDRLRLVRATRDAQAAGSALDRLEQAARGTENLVPLIMDAAAAYCTVGEISDRLRAVFGEYREAA